MKIDQGQGNDMEGGMGPVGPFPNPVVAVAVLLVAPALVILAVCRGERARRDHAHELTLARTRRAYLCFVGGAVFLLIVAAVAIVSQPHLELVGMLGAIPVGLVTSVGLFHALMLWRVRRIQILFLATIFLGVLAGVIPVPGSWVALLGAAYGLGVIVIAGHGLRRLLRSAAS